MTMKTIAIGADDAAIELKNIIKKLLEEKDFQVTDYTNDAQNDRPMYPDVAFALATAIQKNEFERGILLCGTGIGVAIVANKVEGVRAAQCHDTFSAERARKSNNAQIMTMGARVIGPELAKNIVNAWLASEFEGGGSTAKVERSVTTNKFHILNNHRLLTSGEPYVNTPGKSQRHPCFKHGWRTTSQVRSSGCPYGHGGHRRSFVARFFTAQSKQS
jgi:ribose-5-phosphate isomerase (EC 5.3.1.6)